MNTEKSEHTSDRSAAKEFTDMAASLEEYAEKLRVSQAEAGSLQKETEKLREELRSVKERLRDVQAELVKAQTELDMLSHSVVGGTARLSMDDNLKIMTASEGYCRMTGYTMSELMEPPICGCALNFVLPEDVPDLCVALQNLSQSPSPIRADYRIRKKDGSIAWNTAYCAQIHSDGAGQYIDVFFIDNTREQLQKMENARNEERYRIISEQTKDTVFEWDIVNDHIQFSPMYEKMFGFSPPSNLPIRSLTEYDIIYEDDKDRVEKMIQSILDGVPYAEADYRAKCSDGTYLWCRNRVTTLFDSEHRPIRAIGLLSDIDDYMKNTEKLRRRAIRDSLTGLLNRMAFQERAEWNLQNLSDARHAFLLFDIDRFKQLNDSEGHLYGDRMLSQLSSIMTKQFRRTDLLGRMGGDEFAVFMPDISSEQDVFSKARQFCTVIAEQLSSKDGATPVTISIGIALYPEDGHSFSTLYSRADKALYKIKHGGGNAFIRWKQ